MLFLIHNVFDLKIKYVEINAMFLIINQYSLNKYFILK